MDKAQEDASPYPNIVGQPQHVWCTFSHGCGAASQALGADSVGPRMWTTSPLPSQGAYGQQLVAKGAGLRSPWAPKVPAAPWAPEAAEGNFCPRCTRTLSFTPTLTLAPTPTLSLVLSLPLPLALTPIKTEYWD